MASMPATVRTAFETELHQARTAADIETRWRALERAHILSQAWPWPHTRAHWWMLRLALRTHDRTEAFGQIVRLLGAGAASAVGRAPLGNTGRSAVGIMTPMPVPADLADILRDPTSARTPHPQS